jgi:hypothetical protein
MDEVNCLRTLDHIEIDRTIERRIAWREISQQRVAGNIRSSLFGQPHTILSRRSKEITEKTVSDLHQLADLLLTTASDFKLVVSASNAHVYANDQVLIDQVSQLPGITKIDYSRAIVGRPKNTIQLKKPRHSLRSYFKITKITDDQKRNLINFLNNQQESIRLSPALKYWATIPLVRTQDYFFIDHDEMSLLTMLSLVRPGLIRKTQQIIPTK